MDLSVYNKQEIWQDTSLWFEKQKIDNNAIFSQTIVKNKKITNSFQTKLINFKKDLDSREILKSMSMYNLSNKCDSIENYGKIAKMRIALDREEFNNKSKFSEKKFGNCAIYAMQIEELLNKHGFKEHFIVFCKPDHAFNILYHEGVFIFIDSFNGNMLFELDEQNENFIKNVSLMSTYDFKLFSTNTKFKNQNRCQVSSDKVLYGLSKEKFYTRCDSPLAKFYNKLDSMESAIFANRNDVIKSRIIGEYEVLLNKDNGYYDDFLYPEKFNYLKKLSKQLEIDIDNEIKSCIERSHIMVDKTRPMRSEIDRKLDEEYQKKQESYRAQSTKFFKLSSVVTTNRANQCIIV